MRFQLIACNGLYREFCRAAALAAPQLDVSFLPPPCCGGSTALQEQIDQIDSMDRTETPIDAILIGCGLCGIGEEGIVSRRYPMVVPRAHDCAALLLGSPRRYREVFEENGGEIAFYAPELAQQKQHKPTDVSRLTRRVANLVAIDGSLHRPPMVTFSWGALTFQGVVTDVKQTYTLFMPDGMPVRARVELTLKSVTDLARAKRKRPFESPDRTKYRTVHQGEHLWNFAAQEYGDAELWRVIARANGLMNPLDLRPGQVIKLPALEREVGAWD